MATEADIKQMVDRFLRWKLPADFSPDAGISFKPTFNDHLPTPCRHEPTGTNLFTAAQAEAMVRHILGRMTSASERVTACLEEALALVEEYSCKTQVNHIATECEAVVARGRATLSLRSQTPSCEPPHPLPQEK